MPLKLVAVLTEAGNEESIRNCYATAAVRCDNCKYWLRGSCEQAEWLYDRPSKYPESNARAFDIGSCHAWLHTDADFFCSQFEVKDAT